MSNFDLCLPVILRNEGGYTCDPDDKGNYAYGVLKGTKYGISAAAYPDLDIKNLTVLQASAIYKKDYWDNCNLDLIMDANKALQIFDTAVNSGCFESIKIAQEICEVPEDGVLGPITAKAINLNPDFVQRFRQYRVEFYNRIAQNGDNRKYLEGWLDRINNTYLA